MKNFEFRMKNDEFRMKNEQFRPIPLFFILHSKFEIRNSKLRGIPPVVGLPFTHQRTGNGSK